MKKMSRDEVREGCIEWIADTKNRYHLTITFPALTTKAHAKELLDTLLCHLNRRIYKGRYAREESYIKGFAICERTLLLDTVHYHIVIRDENNMLPGFEKFEELIFKQLRRFRGRIQNGNGKGMKKRRYIDEHKLQEYFNYGGNWLERYVTKDLMNPNVPLEEAIASIGLLGPDKVQFGIIH